MSLRLTRSNRSWALVPVGALVGGLSLECAIGQGSKGEGCLLGGGGGSGCLLRSSLALGGGLGELVRSIDIRGWIAVGGTRRGSRGISKILGTGCGVGMTLGICPW